LPYGVSKDVGGDSEQNDSLMERCVKHVMSQGKDKQSAIRICKASIQRSLRSKQRK
jgi:ribosomal protein S7